MSFQITVQPSGHQFTCEPDETILSAAIRAGVGLPYSCKNGACSSCKGKVLSGKVVHGPHQERALPAEEEAAGMSLFCCAKPESDLTVEAREIIRDSEYPVKKVPVRISTLEKLTDDVMVMTLQLPANGTFQYRPGQYVEFMLRDNKRRSYSMANIPREDNFLTLHIRHLPGGLFTDAVFNTLKERDILRFEGPFGTFYLKEDSDKPIILLATGTGFAPIKAIVEQLQKTGSVRPVRLYWGARRPADLYMNDLCQEWATALPNFMYVPVISQPQPEDNWTGKTGYIQNVLMADLPDLSAYEVYACGSPAMVDSAQQVLADQCHLPKDAFFADAFTSEADIAK